MKIRIISLDFDGCIFHERYIFNPNFIQQNKEFLDKIKEENKEFGKAYTIVGSNRQSLGIDNANSPRKGSCFPAITKISEYLGTTLNNLLLADIYSDLPNGTAFNQALYKHLITDDDNIPEWRFDETKATILYAQMHDFANLHPNDEIIYDFFDDRGIGRRGNDHDILEKLRDFYTAHPQLIPSNVTLRLFHYAGDAVTKITEIKGTGFIDQNYRQTVKDMAKQCPSGEMIHATENVKPEQLLNRQPRPAGGPGAQTLVFKPGPGPTISKPVIAEEMKQQFDDSMTVFAAKLKDLEAKKNLLCAERDKNKNSDNPRLIEKIGQYMNAEEAAKAIHRGIAARSQQYFAGIISANAFAKSAKNIIDLHKSKLEEHRGWKEAIINLIIGISSLGIALLINKAATGNFKFSIFTDSAKKLDNVAHAVQEVTASAPAA